MDCGEEFPARRGTVLLPMEMEPGGDEMNHGQREILGKERQDTR